MARIIGVEIPGEKRIDIALRYIYGIGPSNAITILEKAKIDRGIRAKDLGELLLIQILGANAAIDFRLFENGDRVRRPDAVDVAQSDVDALLAGYFNTNDACHNLLALSLFVAAVRADNANDAVPFND